MIQRFLHRLQPAAQLLDLLYPAECALCSAPLTGNDSLCPPCADSLPRLRDPFCSTCGECHDGRIDHTFHCNNCSDTRFAFDFARPVLRRDPRALDLIHRLKYNRQIHLVHSLAHIVEEAFLDSRLAQPLAEQWPLVPVPLHRSRIQTRHFNQAHELALALHKKIGLPVLPCLRRTRPTGTQTALGRKARQKNLKNAFEMNHHWLRPIPAPTRGAILIDDVFTTGATLHECASTLRKAGCPSVIALAVLRG